IPCSTNHYYNSFSINTTPTTTIYTLSPTRRSSDLEDVARAHSAVRLGKLNVDESPRTAERFQITSIPTMILFKDGKPEPFRGSRSEEHTSELQSRFDLVCRLLLEKKKTNKKYQ